VPEQLPYAVSVQQGPFRSRNFTATGVTSRPDRCVNQEKLISDL
jgi:hypothetical protein